MVKLRPKSPATSLSYVPEVFGMKVSVERFVQLADRAAQTPSPMLGSRWIWDTDVHLRPRNGSLHVCSNTIAQQLPRDPHQGDGHKQNTACSHGGGDRPNLLQDCPLASRRLDIVARNHDAALLLLGVLVLHMPGVFNRKSSYDAHFWPLQRHITGIDGVRPGRFSSIVWKVRGTVLFWANRPDGVPSCPSPPCAAPPCAAPLRHDRDMSGFWVRQVIQSMSGNGGTR